MIALILGFLQQAITFILVFGIIVLVHEFGHFVVAKLNGVHVYEFAIGMGPKIYIKQGKETKYTIRLIPMGGFVNMMGEEEESEDPESFTSKTPLQRLSILFAGPFMNFVLAFLIFLIFFASIGVPVNRVKEVVEGYPAAMAGVEVGDKIVKINDFKIESWDDVTNNIGKTGTEAFSMEVERNSEKIILEVETKVSDEGRLIIGILPEQSRAIGLVFGASYEYVSRVATDIFSILAKAVKGKADGENFVGPVGIVSVIGQASKFGTLYVLHIAAIISINLGVFNLLPFPALDGGRIVFTVYEMIFRKPFNQEKERNMHYFGFIVLIMLMIFLVARDILNLLN